MEKEVTELVNRIAQSKNFAGIFMTRKEITELMTKVANDAVVIGWSHAESMTRKRLEKKIDLMEQEMTIIKEQMKSLELDLLAAASK
jgi:cob(I)alamin adenosyltransferase